MKKLSKAEGTRRTKELNGYIDEHGLFKISYASMMSLEGLRMAASPTADRVIALQSLTLISYRLADEAVWADPEYTKSLDKALSHRAKKSLNERKRRYREAELRMAPITPQARASSKRAPTYPAE